MRKPPNQTFTPSKQGSTDPEPLMDRKTAARYLAVSPGTMAVWDCIKRYDLKPIKIGRSVRYRREHLDAFLNGQLNPQPKGKGESR